MAVFSLQPFTCILEHDDEHHDDDDHDDEMPHDAWWCGSPATSTCTPSRPWLEFKDASTGSLKLRWLVLGANTPAHEQVLSLQIKVTPHAGIAYNTSPVPNPSTTNSLVITGLNDGETYTFRLLVGTNNGLLTGAPFTVTL
jgi:hypothetical protein